VPLFRPRSATTSCWMTTTLRVRCQGYKTSFLCRWRKCWTGQIIWPLQASSYQPYVFSKARIQCSGADMGEIEILSLSAPLNFTERSEIFSLYCLSIAPLRCDFLCSRWKWTRFMEQNDSKQSLMTLSQLMLI